MGALTGLVGFGYSSYVHCAKEEKDIKPAIREFNTSTAKCALVFVEALVSILAIVAAVLVMLDVIALPEGWSGMLTGIALAGGTVNLLASLHNVFDAVKEVKKRCVEYCKPEGNNNNNNPNNPPPPAQN